MGGLIFTFSFDMSMKEKRREKCKKNALRCEIRLFCLHFILELSYTLCYNNIINQGKGHHYVIYAYAQKRKSCRCGDR